MGNITYILFICMAVPMALSLFLLETKERQVVLYILLGICCCLFVSEVNGLILSALDDDIFRATTILTPITEEITKAIPIFFFVFIVTADRQRLLSVSLAVGLGFAILENLIILTGDIENVTVLWALGRGFASSLMHSLCTAMVGFGLSFVHTRRKLFVPGTFSLLLMAITFHAVFNCLVQSEYPFLGLLLPIITYIPIVIIGLRINNKVMLKKEKAASAS
ncbi:MAG: PrsW family intramembrane metalloprotease [Clostridia bacterium]|nr:PrsW family intramembrane metalloprotease [Clostridia bacterium]MBQ2500280.1 PrsW family intramembrane metalloprotease [Clostridia bacterium]MBQ3897835.1 PrsW family intramembrane metalloprotease [Clostridia bacterium]